MVYVSVFVFDFVSRSCFVSKAWQLPIQLLITAALCFCLVRFFVFYLFYCYFLLIESKDDEIRKLGVPEALIELYRRKHYQFSYGISSWYCVDKLKVTTSACGSSKRLGTHISIFFSSYFIRRSTRCSLCSLS